MSTHPRTQKRLNAFKSIKLNKNIQFAKPFGFFDYIKLQQEAFCVISDSGTISEEASLLNLPAITIRNAHERPEAIDSGIFIMSGLKKEKVLDAIHATINLHKNPLKKESIQDYESNNASEKILKIVMGYVGYINRTVWYK